MVNFITLDLSLLVIFIIAVVLFLYTRKHNLKREGWLYLYKTKLGLEFIEVVSTKFARILKPLQYVVVASGYALMISMIYLLLKTLFFYFQQPENSPIVKVPAVFPLIPYFPQLFKLDSFFPPFYFTYFIIALAIVAVSHEFSHGIFARLNKIKIHSTGFAFLGPFLGAFVEQDDKQMNKAKKFPQLAILAAGTFANVIMAILFTLIISIFFFTAYSPSGFIFNSYAVSPVEMSSVQNISNVTLMGLPLIKISTEYGNYFTSSEAFNNALNSDSKLIAAFDDAPAINSGLKGAIIEIESQKVTSPEDIKLILSKHNPGDEIEIKTIFDDQVQVYNLKLGEREGKAYLGIATSTAPKTGFAGVFYKIISLFKDPNIYYESRIGPTSDFIYDLLWWVIIINILVALFNMFPAGILDGGRFLMLTVWGITGNKRLGEVSLKIMTWMLLAIIALMMVRWLFAIF